MTSTTQYNRDGLTEFRSIYRNQGVGFCTFTCDRLGAGGWPLRDLGAFSISAVSPRAGERETCQAKLNGRR